MDKKSNIHKKHIDKTQIRLIHIATAQLGVCDKCYRRLLLEFGEMPFEGSTPNPTCKGLTYDEASRLIDYFKTQGFEIKGKKRDRSAKTSRAQTPGGKISKPVSKDQEGYIRWLANRIPWRKQDGLERFIRKLIGRDWPLYYSEGWKVIEALKGWIKNLEKGRTH